MFPIRLSHWVATSMTAAATALPLHGLILLTGDNSANQTDPGTGVPFANVGSMCDTDPQQNSTGSVVSIRGKYILTADHVVVQNQMTFDEITYYEIDEDFTQQKIGTSDMVLLKLREDPGLPDLTLNTNGFFDRLSSTETVLVGYGVGRNTNQASAGSPGVIWEWSNLLATVAKRWGTNSVVAAVNLTDPFMPSNSYVALQTSLNTTAGNDEAASVNRDSGSALFQRISGQWVLSGLATVVTSQNNPPLSSTFNVGTGDSNFYVRISSYASTINNLLPDLSTFAGWAYDNALQAGSDGPADDPDLDGLTNLEEFAFGTDPRLVDIELQPTVAYDGTNAVLSWQQNGVAANLTYTVEFTDDLGTVPYSDTGVTPVQTGSSGDITFWSATVPVAAFSGGWFLRLTVESTVAL